MSEVGNKPPCIRGCRRPCRCDACRAADVPEHGPTPIPQAKGLLCQRCESKLRTWLGDVLEETARLSTRLPTDLSWGQSGHQKVSGSPALVRLDVVSLLDRRSTSVVTEDAETYPENCPEREVISIPQRICSWALLFAEENDLTSDVSTMAASVTLLTAWWETLVAQLWVDDFYADTQQIMLLLNNAHMIERPRPKGLCINVYEVNGKIVDCDHPLYETPGDDRLKCNKCGRKYANAAEIARCRVSLLAKARIGRKPSEGKTVDRAG